MARFKRAALSTLAALTLLTGATPVEASPTKAELQRYARQAAESEGIDPDLFQCQIEQESGWNPDAVSPAGAVGIAQIVPAFHPGVDVLDPYASLNYAAKLMAGFFKRFSGQASSALAAYNAGPGTVVKYQGVPPYPETENYVKEIMACAGYVDSRLPEGPTLDQWLKGMMEDLAQDAIGFINRLDVGALPVGGLEKVGDLNQRFANLRDNHVELYHDAISRET